MTQPSRYIASRTAANGPWRTLSRCRRLPACEPWRTPPACGQAGLRPALASRGFTLVELLAVIMIIAMLAALVTPAVMRSLSAARVAAVKTEIDMLHMALTNYKSEYGAFPPCFLGTVNNASDPQRVRVRNHLKRLFPKANFALAGDTPSPTALVLADSEMNFVPLNSQLNDPSEALVFWLRGFTENPSRPISDIPRKLLYDFDRTRLAPVAIDPITDVSATPQSYRPTSSEAPYVYFDHNSYGTPLAPTKFPAAAGAVAPFGCVMPYFHDVNSDGRVNASAESFANPTSFQIISAGKDNMFTRFVEPTLSPPQNYPYSALELAPGSRLFPVAIYPTGINYRFDASAPTTYNPEDSDNVTNFAKGRLGDEKP